MNKALICIKPPGIGDANILLSNIPHSLCIRLHELVHALRSWQSPEHDGKIMPHISVLIVGKHPSGISLINVFTIGNKFEYNL